MSSEIVKKWNFPKSGGQIRGVADAGVEMFSGNLIPSLARETCQNSLDALRKGQSIVRVEIINYVMPTKEIPGYSDLKKVFQQLKSYWGESSDKAKIFLDNAIKALNSFQINVLRISDYNTTGLSKPYDYSLNSTWNSMTKIDGGSTKPGDKNGGFGIGKNAPYANSLLRTIFYRTLTEDGEVAAQGISRLLSYPEDENMPLETMTSGFGYYGDSNYNRPIELIDELNEINQRTEVGTDLFIYGFNKDASSKNWKYDVIVEILNNFLVAIYTEKLEVNVDGVIINKAKLPELIDEYIKNNKKAESKTCYSNYLVLTSDKTNVIVKEFHSLGNLKLSVLIDPNLDLDKKILRTRKSGMKLFTRKNVSRAIVFSAILEFEGDKLKEFFKILEPPTHDKWESDRMVNDVLRAQAYIDEVFKWEQEVIWKLGENSETEEIDVEGLNEILSNQVEESQAISQEKKETIDYRLGEIQIINRPKKMKEHGNFYSAQGIDENNESEEVQGIIDDMDGEVPAKRKLKGQTPRKKREKHSGAPSEEGTDIVNVRKPGGEKIKLNKLRLFKTGSNIYSVSFVLPYTILKGHIDIGCIGENNKSKKFSIISAKSISNCEGIKVVSKRIEFDKIIGETTVKILFEILDNQNFAMEVNVYEH